MAKDLMQLLRNAVAGNAFAVQTIFVFFQQNSLTPDEQASVHLYLHQASRQNHHAIYFQALLYDHGYGVKRDLDMAFLLMREAAAKGNAKATYEIGHRFLIGKGVEKNYENAFQWLEVAASSPHYEPDAMYDLGEIYEQGLGVETDLILASEWYNKAARKGHIKAKEKRLHE